MNINIIITVDIMLRCEPNTFNKKALFVIFIFYLDILSLTTTLRHHSSFLTILTTSCMYRRC